MNTGGRKKYISFPGRSCMLSPRYVALSPFILHGCWEPQNFLEKHEKSIKKKSFYLYYKIQIEIDTEYV